MVLHQLKRFGLFWWDFLVGDAWELALGGALILGLAYVLRRSPMAAAVAVPLGVVVLLAASSWFGRKR